MAMIEEFFSIAPNIIFTTCLIPDNIPLPHEWWYYSLETGQHISFYTRKSLEIIAKKYNKQYVHYHDLHVFSDKKISEKKLRFAVKRATAINYFIKKQSLIGTDYQDAVARIKGVDKQIK
jgi:hypothetical protein